MEHIIRFQTNFSSLESARFLLDNRYLRVAATCPNLTHLRLDFSLCKSLKPHHVVSLACLLDEYQQARICITIDASDTPAYQYLRRLGFLQRWLAPGWTNADDQALATRDLTSSRLWRFTVGEDTAFINETYARLKACFFAQKDVSALPSYLGEIINNVFDHAFASEAADRLAYALVQYYPSSGRLFVAVADFGIGIPNSVNRFLTQHGHEAVSAVESVRRAMLPLFSSHSRPHNRGRGLDTLRTGIQGLQGFMLIQTSGVLYYLNGAGKEQIFPVEEFHFPGTTLSLRLFENKLLADEAEITDDEASLF